MRRETEQVVARLARSQYGVVTRRQLIGFGVTARTTQCWVEARRLIPIHPGVYRIAGLPVSVEMRFVAATLATRGVLSYSAAAGLHRFEGVRGVRPVVTIARNRKVVVPEIEIHRTANLASVDVTTVSAIPVTTPARTIVDIASSLPEALLEDVIDFTRRTKRATVAGIEEALERRGRQGCKGADKLERLLAVRSDADSAPGSRWQNHVRRVLERAGLPRPAEEHEICLPSGRMVRPDLCYPDGRIVLEYDGAQHEDERQKRLDVEREIELRDGGWEVVRFNRFYLSRPEAIVKRVRHLLG